MTEDVDDFAPDDLIAAGTTAVNPDLFLAERTNANVYADTLAIMTKGMRNPSRTPTELHAAIARQHPRLFARFANLFPIAPAVSEHRPPATLFRGATCLRCLVFSQAWQGSPDGVCVGCLY